MGERPLVSVLIVTFNHADEIAQCLDGVAAQRSDAHDLEVIVVDNGSSDGTPEVIASHGGDVKVLALDTNTGFAAGVNTAFEHASGQVVVLLNPDCVMDPGCIEALWRHLAANPGVAVAAADLRYPDGRPQLFARRELTFPTVLWCFTEVGRRIDRRRGGPALAHRRYAREMATPLTEPLEVDCPAAACVAAWRRLLEPRPMDPLLPIVFNDGELCRRLRAEVYRCEIVPAATAAHAYGTSLQRVARARMRAEFVASMRRYEAAAWPKAKRAALASVLALDAVSSAALGVTGPDRASARLNLRGTLGGLGLPGGAQPWLAPIPSPAQRLAGVARAARPEVRGSLRSLSRRARRRWFIARLRVAAWLSHSRAVVDVHPTADLPTRATFEVRRRSRPVVRIGREAHIQPGLVLRLAGELDVGARAQLRYGVNVNVKGRLELAPRVAIGAGTTIHADGTMVLEWGAIVGEMSSIIDSNHELDGTPLHPLDHPVGQRDIRVGAGCFVGAHSTVTAGVTIGRGSVIGAGSVVTRDVPDGTVAAGVPAKPVRALPRWPPRLPE